MEISLNGIDFIIANEGIRYTAYLDTVGVWTIGVGHTKGVYAGMTITHAQAIAFLQEDIKTHQRFKSFFKRSFNQNQFDALCSFEFNLGGGIWARDGWNPYATDSNIAYMMSLYKRPSEITARRNREIALFNKPFSSGNNSNNNIVPVPPQQPKNKRRMDNMEFIFTVPKSGTTWYFDGKTLWKLSADYQLNHIRGNYKKVYGVDITAMTWTKEQLDIWKKAYGEKVWAK